MDAFTTSDRHRFSPATPVSQGDDVFLSFDDLAAHGISYHRKQLRRLIRAGDFPAPYQLSRNRIAWRRSEIRRWIETRPVAASAA